MGNAVVYFEVGGPEDEPLIDFYRELFGWGLQRVGEGINYTLIDTNGGDGLNGGLGKSGTGEPWSTFYVEVEDVQATLDKVASLGGKTVVPVTEIPGFGTFAMFDDPDGLLIGLAKARAEQLGATRVYGPMAVDDHMQTGALRDPAGNVFGVYHHEDH